MCRQLGLPYSNAQPVGAAVFGEGSGQIWLNKVSCYGFEDSVDECIRHSGYPWGGVICSHRKDAGVVCKNGNDSS